MTPIFVLDACAVIAVVKNSKGADVVDSYYDRARKNELALRINKINLLEVYYTLIEKINKNEADLFLNKFKQSMVVINDVLSEDIFQGAAYAKTTFGLSMGDCFAYAETVVSKGTLITSDRKCFNNVKTHKALKIQWLY